MHKLLLVTVLFSSQIGGLFAQQATAPGGTIRITANPAAGGQQVTTFAIGTAAGTPLNGAQITFRPDDEVAFDNAAALINTNGACNVTGANLEISISTTVFGFPLSLFNTTINLVPGSCATAPAALPACGPGDQVFVAPANVNTSLDLGSVPNIGLVPTNQPITSTFVIRPIADAGCTVTPTTSTTTFFLDPNAPVPVQLTRFEAAAEGGRFDRVEWSSLDEVALAGYGVERSADGVTFEEVAFVDARGTEDGARDYAHSVAKASAKSTVRYYRLRALDFDGSVQYSPVAVVKDLRDAASEAPLLKHNVINEGGDVGLANLSSTSATVEVADLSGRRIAAYPPVSGLRIGGDLPAGTYVVRTLDSDGGSRAQLLFVR